MSISVATIFSYALALTYVSPFAVAFQTPAVQAQPHAPIIQAQPSEDFDRPLTPDELGAAMIQAEIEAQNAAALGKSVSMHIHRNGRPEVVIYDPSEEETIIVDLPSYFDAVLENVNAVSPDQEYLSKIYGVTPEFIQALKALGYSNLSHSQLVSMKIYQIDEAFIKEVATLGYENLSVEELFYVKVSGVSIGKLAELKNRLVENASVTDLLIHAHEADHKLELVRFSAQRGIKSKKGGAAAFADRMITFSTPPVFRAEKTANSQTNTEQKTIQSPGELSDLKVATGREIVVHISQNAHSEHFRVRTLDADSQGKSHATLFNMRVYGVTPEFVQEIKDAGYAKLSPEEYIRLKRYGVTAADIRSWAGPNDVRLTVDQIIELKLKSAVK
jgi:hypothetical protein